MKSHIRYLLPILAATLLSTLSGCGREREETVYDFVEGLAEATVSSWAPSAVEVRDVRVNDEMRTAIQVPSTTTLSYVVLIPPKARLDFGCATAPYLWNEPGDGVLFEITVTTGAQREVIVHSRYVDAKNNPEARRWFDEKVNLTAFENQQVTLSLSTKAGPAGDNRYDAAVWASPRLVGRPR